MHELYTSHVENVKDHSISPSILRSVATHEASGTKVAHRALQLHADVDAVLDQYNDVVCHHILIYLCLIIRPSPSYTDLLVWDD
jgi:hypothetical protein